MLTSMCRLSELVVYPPKGGFITCSSLPIHFSLRAMFSRLLSDVWLDVNVWPCYVNCALKGARGFPIRKNDESIIF